MCSSTTLKGNIRDATGDFLLIHSCDAVLARPDNGLAHPMSERFTMVCFPLIIYAVLWTDQIKYFMF